MKNKIPASRSWSRGRSLLLCGNSRRGEFCARRSKVTKDFAMLAKTGKGFIHHLLLK
jgi:hypothetical protein